MKRTTRMGWLVGVALVVGLPWVAVADAGAGGGGLAPGDSELETILARHVAVRTAPAKVTPCMGIPDGQLLGNGDLGVVVAGTPERQDFYISKNDFWVPGFAYRSGGHQRYPIGGITLAIPQLTGAKFRQEMDFYRAESRGVFSQGPAQLRCRALTPASENVLLLELVNEGKTPLTIQVETWTRSTEQRWNYTVEPKYRLADSATAGAESDQMWITRDSRDKRPADKQTHASIVTRVLDGDGKPGVAMKNSTVDINGLAKPGNLPLAGTGFTLAPGRRVRIVAQVGVAVWFGPDFPLTKVKEMVVQGETSLPESRRRCAQWTGERLDALVAEHQAWWRQYWAKGARLELPAEPLLERFFYGAVYFMGAATRPGKLPPGLYGPWVTSDQVAWEGDYHLDYNHQHPWYGVYGINRCELAQPYFDSIVNLLPLGRDMAQHGRRDGAIAPGNTLTRPGPAEEPNGAKGVHFTACAGPFGWTEFPDFGMPNNVESTINFRDYYEFTQDAEFLRTTAYPFMKEVALNWETGKRQRLVKEMGPSGRADDYRYLVMSAHSETHGTMTNPTTALAFIRALYSALIKASTDLKTDTELRAHWQEIYGHLSQYPTVEYKGKKIFDYAEKPSNPAGNVYPYNSYPFYPAATEDLDSPYRDILVNTLKSRSCYFEHLGSDFTQSFAAAAAGGYPATELAAALRKAIAKGLCVENGVVVLNIAGEVASAFAVNNVVLLLLQSNGECIRLFPVWDMTKDARFVNLRARGAFLVSAQLKAGVISGVTLVSEKGKDCQIVNPWPGRKVQVVRNKQISETVAGDRFTLKTAAGETIELREQ